MNYPVFVSNDRHVWTRYVHICRKRSDLRFVLL